jgi:hypothetical protein
MDWIQIQETQGIVQKQGILVLDSFKGHLTLEVRSVIHAMTDLVIPKGMT